MSARACEVIRRLEALLQANKNNFSMIAFLCFNPPHKHPLPRRQRRRRERCGRTKRTTESRPLSTPVSTVFLLPPSTKTYRTAHDPKVLTRGSQPATIRSTQWRSTMSTSCPQHRLHVRPCLVLLDPSPFIR